MMQSEGVRNHLNTEWTADRVDLIIALYLEGLSAAKIAQRLAGHFSRSAVLSKLNRCGAKLRGPRRAFKRKPEPPPKLPVDWEATLRTMHAASASDVEIGRALGVSENMVRSRRKALGLSPWCRRPAIPFTAIKAAEIAALWARGASHRRMMAETGLSDTQVHREVEALREASGGARPARAKDHALVAKLVAEGGFPRLSERVGKSGQPVACLPLIWDARAAA